MTEVATGKQNLLTRWSKKFDDFLRYADLFSRRTAGGWMDRKFGISRHSGAALILPALLSGLLLVETPTVAHAVIAAVVAVVVCGLLILLMRLSTQRNSPIGYDLLSQTLLIGLLLGGIWIGSPDEYSPDKPYRDLFTPLTAAAAIALLCGAMLLPPLFTWLRTNSLYPGYLKVTELFAERGATPPFSFGTMVVSAVAVAVRAPMALLTLPALVILLAPPAWITVALAVSGIFYVIALLFAGLNDRFGLMWSLLQESFFKGGALFISVIVIALAAARLAGITYVTTVFDSAAWWTIALLLAKAYLLSWWFDYWSHRLLTDQVMRIMDPGSKGVASIPYPIEAAAKKTHVPIDQRKLQIHGAARFLVVREKAGETTYFQAWSPVELTNLLAGSGGPGGNAVPPPHLVASRIATYQAITSLVFALLVGWTLWHIHTGYQMAEAVVKSQSDGLSLADLIKQRSTAAPAEPLFIIAASGGGTRAAVYTASILEAIARQGKAANIVLGSGVSGGGAALAYFAGHRQALISNEPGAWDKYFTVMSQPYIQDVLERSTEWYMVEGGRLGMLLADSFKERWSLPPDRKTLTAITDFGLILNTALAGHFKTEACVSKCQLYEIEQKDRFKTQSTLAGGRLLLTNLKFPASLTSEPLEPDAGVPQLPIVIRSPDLTLETAAALNANFPPVFSNAAIDVDDKTRYWVTDGGAVDNRGLEMMLYALREMLGSHTEGPLPNIHVIVADASALSTGFEQDRGISAMSGAGAHYASHLDAELVAGIKKLYPGKERFTFSYVMMPDILRQSGSFGTHWMLQHSIKVRHRRDTDLSASKDDHDSLTISGEEMVQLIRTLHSAQPDALSKNACRIYHWVAEDTAHANGWASVQKALGGSPAPAVCEREHGQPPN